YAHPVQGGYRLLCPLKRPASCRDSELDGFLCHVEDCPAVERDHVLLPADAPDIADAFLEIPNPCPGVGVQHIPDILGSNDLPGTADPKADLVFGKVGGEQHLRGGVDDMLGMDRNDDQDTFHRREGEGRRLDCGHQDLV